MRDQMIVKMTKCDNPTCPMVDQPENLKPYVPPYGWLRVKGHFIGCGPNVDVEVCSLKCLHDAIEHVIDEDARQ